MFDWFNTLSFGWQLYILCVSIGALALGIGFAKDYVKTRKTRHAKSTTLNKVSIQDRPYDWAIDGL